MERAATGAVMSKRAAGSGGDEAAADELVLPYEPVAVINLARFIGRWFEVAKIPNRWQANGAFTTVSYVQNPRNNRLRIVSRTFVDDGARKVEQQGRLWVLDHERNSSYRVQFCWPFSGEFWIVHVGNAEDYGYAVLGDPIKCNLWILSRTPTMEEFIYEKLVAQLEWQGYDVSKLVKTPQRESEDAYDDDLAE